MLQAQHRRFPVHSVTIRSPPCGACKRAKAELPQPLARIYANDCGRAAGSRTCHASVHAHVDPGSHSLPNPPAFHAESHLIYPSFPPNRREIWSHAEPLPSTGDATRTQGCDIAVSELPSKTGQFRAFSGRRTRHDGPMDHQPAIRLTPGLARAERCGYGENTPGARSRNPETRGTNRMVSGPADAAASARL